MKELEGFFPRQIEEEIPRAPNLVPLPPLLLQTGGEGRAGASYVSDERGREGEIYLAVPLSVLLVPGSQAASFTLYPSLEKGEEIHFPFSPPSPWASPAGSDQASSKGGRGEKKGFLCEAGKEDGRYRRPLISFIIRPIFFPLLSPSLPPYLPSPSSRK